MVNKNKIKPSSVHSLIFRIFAMLS